MGEKQHFCLETSMDKWAQCCIDSMPSPMHAPLTAECSSLLVAICSRLLRYGEIHEKRRHWPFLLVGNSPFIELMHTSLIAAFKTYTVTPAHLEDYPEGGRPASAQPVPSYSPPTKGKEELGSGRDSYEEQLVAETASPLCLKDRRMSFRSKSQREISLCSLCSARSFWSCDSMVASSAPEV